jgi:hypothetical protein
MFDCSVHHVDQFTDHPVMKLLARGWRARGNGVASVEGEVRNSNLAMMNAAKNQGRMAVSTRWVTYV